MCIGRARCSTFKGECREDENAAIAMRAGCDCRIWIVAMVIAAVTAPLASAAEPTSIARDEIDHLLIYLERSGCEFFRNGDWYTAKEAKDNLNQKYAYLLKKGMVREAEDFIRLAATSSSVSGKAYQVRCKPGDPVASQAWLTDELTRYRRERNPK